MKPAAPSVLENVQAFRKSRSETQAEFWKRFGLTQPGGSRYENGQPIPRPTAVLLDLFASGTISEEQLAEALVRAIQSPNVSSANDAPARGPRDRSSAE